MCNLIEILILLFFDFLGLKKLFFNQKKTTTLVVVFYLILFKYYLGNSGALDFKGVQRKKNTLNTSIFRRLILASPYT